MNKQTETILKQIEPLYVSYVEKQQVYIVKCKNSLVLIHKDLVRRRTEFPPDRRLLQPR